MEQTAQEFFHDFRQELMAGAEANSAFQLAEFMDAIARELIDTGFVDGFDFCHFRAQRGMRVDGYWFDDEGALDLFVADFESRDQLASLTQTDVVSSFKRLTNFFEASRMKDLFKELEETSPEYGLARQISDRKGLVRRINCYLVSERALSERLQTLESDEVAGVPVTYHIWDISRLQRQRSSRGQKEPLDINFVEMFGKGISGLPAHLGSGTYKSYLMVIPGEVLCRLYEKFGARLLEQNVRSFLQARGKVNKGIRTTLLNEPEMFFAYNNGITATAQELDTKVGDDGLQITRIKDLQIVNGGQTTASLYHTKRKDKVSLDNVFVQMKLSVIENEESEKVVPKISEYANTQNRVNAADFFSNTPFHIRIEEFSRRIWAPAQQGAQRETKWFYERARGQYADAQSKLTPAEQRRYKAEYPKSQMFTKTDLAKFENVWDEHPRWVNLGAQKNFAKYAARVSKEWKNSADNFNENYFKRAVVRALIFRRTEKLVSDQAWYNGGYRANIVAYAIALINECCKNTEKSINYIRVWNNQELYGSLIDTIVDAAKFVSDDISNPPSGISNISEWCKKEACWQRLLTKLPNFTNSISSDFWDDSISIGEVEFESNAAKKIQAIDDGINAQTRVCELSATEWSSILSVGQKRGILTPKEIGVLNIAGQIPSKIPSEKQSMILLEVLNKAKQEGILVDE